MHKMAVIFINELQNDPAKLVMLCGEALLKAYEKAGWGAKRKWNKDGRQKVVVHVLDKLTVMQLKENAEKFGLKHFLLDGDDKSVILVVGPEESEKLNKLSANLRLF